MEPRPGKQIFGVANASSQVGGLLASLNEGVLREISAREDALRRECEATEVALRREYEEKQAAMM
jgi:hypothetical protein